MISQLRAEIDKIDQQLISLFLQRIDVVESIGRYKKDNQLPTLDNGRENIIRQKLESTLADSDYQGDAMDLMENIMSICRKIQNRTNENNKPKVAYQGTEGSYSEEASINYFVEGCNRTSYPTFEAVFSAVTSGEMEYGVVPIENSSTGGIREVYDLLLKYDLNIVGEYSLKINHHLIGIPGASIDNIREVYSHPQGIEQCSQYLSYHRDWKKISYLNTASSVKHVGKMKDDRLAAIGSGRAAEIYELEILKDVIQDNDTNTTRFIVLKRDEEENHKADKTSLVFTTSHAAGSLFNVLAVFAEKNISMMKIESRPIKHQPGQYTFYVDIDGSKDMPHVKAALEEINNRQKFFRILGNYQKYK
jgi:chorismate mutase/prephenate dehydratase